MRPQPHRDPRQWAALMMVVTIMASTAYPIGRGEAATASGASAHPVETFALPNGLTVILQEDHSLPKAVITVRYAVGSKDEAPGRTGFAHLFEHLMFMGTGRVPGNQFDVLMEGGGGENNASTSEDRTTYYSLGPSELLPTLLWLDADRLEALGEHMTQEKLDLQRDVVRNERRQSYENAPYGRAELMISEAMWPDGHPYHHPVIGSHEDLQAASLQDVKDFFATWYVPANAVLAVVGDFETAAVKEVIAATFGAVPARPSPARSAAAKTSGARAQPTSTLSGETTLILSDDVELAKLYLVWRSPAAHTEGDAAMRLVASILAGSPSSRLDQRLKIERRLAQEIEVYQNAMELGSQFHVEITAAPGVSLDQIKRETIAVIGELMQTGPRKEELQRVLALYEAGFRRRHEGMLARAIALTDYQHAYGEADAFARDLARHTSLTPAKVRDSCRGVFGPDRLDLRVFPTDSEEAKQAEATGRLAVAARAANAAAPPEPERPPAKAQALVPEREGADARSALDQRPSPFPERSFRMPAPESFLILPSGLRVDFVARPGSGLFAGALVAAGGESAVPGQKAGLSALAASMLTAGAGSRTAAQFAEAVEMLGARISAEAGREALTVRVQGLSARLRPTLALLADAVLRPNLAADDFERERGLLAGRIRARSDNPSAVARLAARTLLHGHETPAGRPVEGYAETVAGLTLNDLRAAVPALLDPRRSRLILVGDFTRADLERALAGDFAKWPAKWRSAGGEAAQDATGAGAPMATSAAAAPEAEGAAGPPPGRVVLIDRPNAPQTVIYLIRPLPAPSGEEERAVRTCLTTLFGGSFTSRLNQNLRERNGFTYGARSALQEGGGQFHLTAWSSVRTDVTDAALAEFKNEFDGLAGGNVTSDELDKAVKTERRAQVEAAETCSALAERIVELATIGRPLAAMQVDVEWLGAVSLERTNEVARAGLYRWDELLVVLVGDVAKVMPQLKAAGFAKPRLADVEGRPLDM